MMFQFIVGCWLAAFVFWIICISFWVYNTVKKKDIIKGNKWCIAQLCMILLMWIFCFTLKVID